MSPENKAQPDPEADEARLVERARAGDAAAMGRLLESYQQRVFSLCSRMVNHREDAADLTQEVLTKVITGLSGFDGRSSLSTWIYRLAMNTSISHLRKRRTARAGGGSVVQGGLDSPDSGDAWPKSPVDLEPRADQSVQTNEQRRLLVEALQNLGDEARALLVLRDGRGLDYETIADVLDLRIGTVKSRLFRARVALRKALHELEKPAVRSAAN
ncbi:MAG: sigma-70 family RNA polymerase sigma factor [Phycisphaerales bacterium]|nr:sigma-70 family RNA polymerase sigma factor [Phycisphaerales bacterium]